MRWGRPTARSSDSGSPWSRSASRRNRYRGIRDPPRPSIIVYTPSGYVGVHFPPLNRQKFAAEAPTDAEARAALAGYVGYFGALSVYPNMVFHQILSGISFAGGTTLKRPLEMNGDEVTIKFPVNANATTNPPAQQTTTWVTLRRLSGEEAMLPAAARSR